MFLYLILSTIAAGIIATSVMVAILYLPLLWQGEYIDVFGALGSAVTRAADGRARFLGGIFYYAGGLFFAFFYGWATLALMRAGLPVDEFVIFAGAPVEINLFYPFIGLAIGLAHGVLVALLLTIVVIEHHPLDDFHERFGLVLSQLVSHMVFGATVMFFHSQFLQLFLEMTG